jgi:RNA polymerase sigma-70 factor (ECF subfamily)
LHAAKNYTEDELLDGLRRHDEQAYSFLYDHYSKALFLVIFRIVPQQEIAEDILQEVFVKIWQNIQTYDASKGRMYTWMLNIGRNQAIDRTRSREFNNRAKTAELSQNVCIQGENLEREIGDAGLKRTLDVLNDQCRKLLELAYFQGYTHEEIAKIMDLPLGTVKTRIRTTMHQLRKILGGKN